MTTACGALMLAQLLMYLLSEVIRSIVPARDVEVKGNVGAHKVSILQRASLGIIHGLSQVQVPVEEHKSHVGPACLEACTACTTVTLLAMDPTPPVLTSA